MTTLKPVTTDEWAATLATTGLTPGPTFGYRTVGSGWDAAVHIALSDQLTPDARAELIAALQEAVGSTVRRVLCVSDAVLTTATHAGSAA